MRPVTVKLLLFSLLVGLSASSINGDCVLPLPRFRFFAPLIFSQEGNLLPTDSYDEHSLTITVPSGSKVILSCAPGYFKKSSFNSSKSLSAECKNNQIFDVKGVEASWLTDLGCEVRPVEEILERVSGCPNGATSVEFGYENPVKSHTRIIGEACYSEPEGRTLSVHTTLVENSNKKDALLRSERVNYLAKEHPGSSYKIDFLVAARLDELNPRLEKILLSKKVPFLEARHFIDLPLFQNGQLNSALKLGWNFAVTNGFDHLPNYDLLLNDIISLKEKSFDLYMGTYSVLSLKNLNQDLVEIYLLPDEKKYQVPEFLWVVVTTESGKGAGFLISNNIDAKEEDIVAKAPCQSKCSQMNWLTNLLEKDTYKIVKNGFVVCCDLDSFLPVVHEMPSLEGKFPLLKANNIVQEKQYETFDI